MRKTILSVLLAMACCSMLAENVMTANDVTIKAGDNAVLTIGIDNDMNVAAFDFRLYLPEGVTVVWDDDLQDYAWEWCDRVPHNSRGSFFSMTPMVTDDGSLMFGANSGTSGKVLDGNSGPVLTLTIHATASAKSGTGKLMRISLSNEDGSQSVKPEDVTFNITMTPTTGINDIKQDELKANIYNLSGQRLSQPQKGVNIIDGKKVLVR